ncbi:MAG: phage holin family protein [Bacteroidia bacterium]
MEGVNKVEELIGKLKTYFETRFDIVALNTQDKVSNMLSSIASTAVVALFVMFIVFFASVGAAWRIGEILNSPSIGFFCVAGFYLMVAIIVVINKDRWIKTPLINALLKKININEND